MNLLDFLAAAVRSVLDNTASERRRYVLAALEGGHAYDARLEIWWTDGTRAYTSLHYIDCINGDDLLSPRPKAVAS